MAVLFLALLSSCTIVSEPCDLTGTASELAGDGSVTCGAVGAEVAEADWACALEAWEGGAPFVLLWSSTGIDSVIESAWVFDGSRTWLLSQDQYGSEPWDIDGYECVSPSVESDEDLGYDVLACGSIEPEGNHYQVCGDLCTDCGEPDPLPFEP